MIHIWPANSERTPFCKWKFLDGIPIHSSPFCRRFLHLIPYFSFPWLTRSLYSSHSLTHHHTHSSYLLIIVLTVCILNHLLFAGALRNHGKFSLIIMYWLMIYSLILFLPWSVLRHSYGVCFPVTRTRVYRENSMFPPSRVGQVNAAEGSGWERRGGGQRSALNRKCFLVNLWYAQQIV